MKTTNWTLKILILGLTALLLAPSQGLGSSKSSSLKFLKSLKEKYSRELDTLDRDIVTMVQSTPNGSNRNLSHQETEILIKSKRRFELSNKVDLLDHLIYQFDQFYTGQPLRAFIASRLAAMLAREVGIGSNNTNPKEYRIRFLLRMRHSLVNSNIRDKQVMGFIEGHLITTNITDPKPIGDFNKSSAYSNSVSKEKAVDTNLEEAGDYVDEIWPENDKASKKSPESGRLNRLKKERILEPYPSWWKDPNLKAKKHNSDISI